MRWASRLPPASNQRAAIGASSSGRARDAWYGRPSSSARRMVGRPPASQIGGPPGVSGEGARGPPARSARRVASRRRSSSANPRAVARSEPQGDAPSRIVEVYERGPDLVGGPGGCKNAERSTTRSWLSSCCPELGRAGGGGDDRTNG